MLWFLPKKRTPAELRLGALEMLAIEVLGGKVILAFCSTCSV